MVSEQKILDKSVSSAKSVSSLVPNRVHIRTGSKKLRPKNSRIDNLVESYKKLDLNLYVVRRAHAKCFKEADQLVAEENRILNEQEKLFQEIDILQIKGREDIIKILEIWHLEAVSNRGSKALSYSEKMILKVYNALKWGSA